MKDNSKKANRTLIVVGSIALIIIVGVIACAIFMRCPSGYSYKNKTCSRVITKDYSITRYCDIGYQLEGVNCKMVDKLVPTKKYNCPYLFGDYTISISAPVLVGSSCKYTYSYAAVEKKECPVGCSMYTQSTCLCTSSFYATYFRGVYSCPSGYTVAGDRCIKYQYVNATSRKVCTTGFSLIGSRCVRDYYENANYTLECPIGYVLQSNLCERTIYTSAKIEYTCPRDYSLSGNQCEKIVYEKPLY